MMITTGLIGYGKWGQVIYSKLAIISKIVFIYRNSDDWHKELPKVDWVFVVTPDKTHFDIVAKCLSHGRNVFCEKPLSLSLSQSSKLYEIADRYNVKLYVDDVQNYNNKSYSLRKNNYIERKKFSLEHYDTKDLLYRLAYHDIYMIYDQVKDSKINNIQVKNIKKCLNFSIDFNEVFIEFMYDVEFMGNKTDTLNGDSVLAGSGVDPLMKMIVEVITYRANFVKNKEIALFTNNLIERVNEKI